MLFFSIEWRTLWISLFKSAMSPSKFESSLLNDSTDLERRFKKSAAVRERDIEAREAERELAIIERGSD